jgi:precorrin-3B synthase
VSVREEPDRCPGALQLHPAADGPLARVRVPGGTLSAAQLQALAELARDLGDGAIELTSRGNVQLRALSDPGAAAGRIAAAGLLPSPTHERVRNIISSPLSGRIGGMADVRDWARRIDELLRGAPVLADLPGRFLVTVDDGSGDVSGLSADIGLHALGAGAVALLLAGADTGVRLSDADVADTVIAAARVFQRLRGRSWRLAEVEGGVDRVVAELGLAVGGNRIDVQAPGAAPIGWLEQQDGLVALGAAVPLGRLDARLAEFVAAIERPVIVTPWRTLLIVDLAEWAAEQVVRVLAPMGLVFDAESPWAQVSACAGQPGCANSLADVRADLAEAVELSTLPVEGRQHWVGCERSCGTPAGPVHLVEATGEGYRVHPPRDG